jgi:DNA-binding NtrC family response regulator
MSLSGFATPISDPGDIKDQPHIRHSDTFPALLAQDGPGVEIPNGLVISADDAIRTTLGETLLLCGVAATFATTIADSRKHFAAGKLSLVLCEDLLPDGKYSDILKLTRRATSNAPVIVVSPTGDWQDYFAAIELGAHDFLAYPLIRGELQRIIHNCFAECRQLRTLSATSF